LASNPCVQEASIADFGQETKSPRDSDFEKLCQRARHRSVAGTRDTTPFGKQTDFVFPSIRLEGKKPLSASIMVQKYLRPAAVKAGVIKEGQKVRFGFHNFRHSLATALVKLKVDAKTVQGMLRHEDFGTTMQLYAQSDMESMRDAQGKFLEQLLGDRIHLLTDKVQ
jgi:integrase